MTNTLENLRSAGISAESPQAGRSEADRPPASRDDVAAFQRAMRGEADGSTFERLEHKFRWQRDAHFIRNLTDSVLDFEQRCRIRAEALERARLLDEQAERLKQEAARLGNR